MLSEGLKGTDEILRLKENIKDIRIEILEGCGHSPHTLLEKPMSVNETIYNFFKQIKATQ